MHTARRVGELLNVFYLLEDPRSAAYGRTSPTTLAPPAGIQCSDSQILTRGILNFQGVLERLRIACDSEYSLYSPVTALLEGQEHFRSLGAKQQGSRSDASHERIGRPPRRTINYVRFYDWHVCSCILSPLELNTFQRALRVLLEVKQPIKITSDISVNPGEWMHPYGSSKPLHIIANMGRQRSSDATLSPLLTLSYQQDAYTAVEEGPEPVKASSLLPAVTTWLKHPPALSQQSSHSLGSAEALSNIGLLSGYFIGSFLSQPLQRNKLLSTRQATAGTASGTADAQLQPAEDCNRMSGDVSLYAYEPLCTSTYSQFGEPTSLSDTFCRQPSDNFNQPDSKTEEEELTPELSSRNICTLQTATADGIAILGEYFKNERLWKQQTAALLAKRAVMSIEDRLRQRNRLKSSPKTEAVLIEQFWSTVTKAISLRAADDINNEEIMCLVRDSDDNSQNYGHSNHPPEIEHRAAADNTIELSELAPFADPHSPVPPFEPLEVAGPKHIDCESLYCMDGNLIQGVGAISASMPAKPTMQIGSVDHTDTPHLCPLYQNVRQIFRLFSADLSVSLNLLQILFTNLILKFLTLSQLLSLSTSTCWYHTVTFVIRTGRIMAVSIRPQQGSKFLFRARKATHRQSFLQLRSSYKYLPMDLALLNASYQVHKQQKTPQEGFLARLEITRAAVCRLLYLHPSAQYTPETHSITQLFMLSDQISAHGLILETRFFMEHSLLLNNNTELSTLTEVDVLIKFLTEYLMSEPLFDFGSFNSDILLSEYYLKHQLPGKESCSLTSSHSRSVYDSTLVKPLALEQVSEKKDNRVYYQRDHLNHEAVMLYNQLLSIYKDTLPLFFTKADDSKSLPKRQTELDMVAPYLYYHPNIRHLLPYQAHMLLGVSASYITGNNSFIIRAPRKVGVLRFVISTFLTRSAALQNLRYACAGMHLEGKGVAGLKVPNQIAPSATKKDYSSASLDGMLRREQVHLVLCEEGKVEGFVNMYIRLLFGARVYDVVSREMFGQNVDQFLLDMKSRKLSQEHTHVDDVSSVADHCSGQSSTFYPSSVSPINFMDILGQKMLLDDMESTLFITILSCNPHRNSVPVAEITKGTAFGPLKPRSSNSNVFRCMSSSDCNPATISLPYARRCEASHKPSRANDASYLGMELLDTNPVDSERHVRCVSYVIGPEAENQKTISVPSRIVFNLFDQLHGFQQSSNQVDQPTSIKVFVVTYDALHYNYAYTNGQILSLIKEAKRLDTLVVHRIKDHAPHLPIHMYKADFIVNVESAYLLNKGDDLRQEEETRKKLLQLQSAHSTTLTDKASIKQLQTHDKRATSSVTIYSSAPSHERISQPSCTGDQTVLSEQNDPSPLGTDRQSEQSYILYDTVSAPSSSLTRVIEDTPVHLLFFDLVALNYEPSTPVLTSIYDMKLLDKVLTDPAIALLFLDASKKGSCSIYLHDIHGYGPQIAYRFPNLQHIPLVVPRRDRQYVQDLSPSDYFAHFPLHQQVVDVCNPYSFDVIAPSKRGTTLQSLTTFGGPSYSYPLSYPLRNFSSKFRTSDQSISDDTLKLVTKFISFDSFITDLNASYNALLVQHQIVTAKHGSTRTRHSTNFWSHMGAYMNPVVLTTTMNVSSLDSVASILARSHSIAFGRGSEGAWLRMIDSDLWDSYAYPHTFSSICNSMIRHNARFPSAYKDSLGSSLDMTVVSDIRRSFPEKYLNAMISHLEHLQQLWVRTDGSLFLIPAAPRAAPRSSVLSHYPSNQSTAQTLSHNMSIPFSVYDKLFIDFQKTVETNHNQKSLCFVSSGDSWSNISRSVVYQTRSISLLVAIELIDIFKRLLYRQTPHGKLNNHMPNPMLQASFEAGSFSAKDRVSKPVLDMLASQLNETLVRIETTAKSLLFSAYHSYHTSMCCTTQQLTCLQPMAKLEKMDRLPNLVVFSLLNTIRLTIILPRYTQLVCAQARPKLYGDPCICPHATSTFARIKNKLSYAVELKNKATYVFKIPFKMQIQPKYLSMLHKRPLLQHLYQLDNQNTRNLHDNFFNRIDFSSMWSRIEANNNSISQYVGSLLFFYRMLLSIDANISSSTTSRDTQFVVAFPFAHNFYSSVTMQLLGSAPSGHMLDSFGCLLPLKLVTYSATQHPIYSITREDKLVGGFLIASSTPNDISLYSINCGASAISRGKDSTVPDNPPSLLSAFLNEINPSEEDTNVELLSSMLVMCGRLCCATCLLSSMMYKILANSTSGVLASAVNLIRLLTQEIHTLNVIYTETPVIVAVCFAIRRLFIEFGLYGKRHKPTAEIIKQSYRKYRQEAHKYKFGDDHATLCPMSLQRLNNVTLASAMSNANKSASNVNSSPPLSNDSPRGSNCFNVRYTDASQSSNENQRSKQTINGCLPYKKENSYNRVPLSPPESSIARELIENKGVADRHTPSRVLYISTKEPPRKRGIASKADELGQITASIRSEISAVDAAERANEPSEGSNDLSEFCQSTQPEYASKCTTSLLYSREQGVTGAPTDGVGNMSALLKSHTEERISKPYTLYHDNSDDNEHDIDDAFLRTMGFNFILVLVSTQDTLQMLGAIMGFSLGDCNANIIIPKSNEVLAYITPTTSAATTVSSIGRKNLAYIGLSELSTQSKKSCYDNNIRTTTEAQEPILRNLANEEGKCIVLQTVADFIDSVERFRDAQRIHLFAMPCVQNILIVEAIHRANMAEKIICWSSPPLHRAFDHLLADVAISAELLERLRLVGMPFQDDITSLPEELQYTILNQAGNRPLQQLLVSIVGLIKEFGYNISRFSIFDDDPTRFAMPKFDSSMEQESLSTESQIDAEKMSDEFPNNGRHDAEITECDPQPTTEYTCRTEPPEYLFVLDCNHKNNRHTSVLQRCVKHAICEKFQEGFSVGPNAEDFDIRHSLEPLGTEGIQHPEYNSVEKDHGQTDGSIMLHETLAALSSLRGAYSQLTSPLRSDMYQMDLSCCPLTIVKLLSQAVLLSKHSNVSHFDAFVSSSCAGKMLDLSGVSGAGGANAPGASKFHLTNLIANILSNNPDIKASQVSRDNVLLAVHSTSSLPSLSIDAPLNYPPMISLKKIESFYPVRLHCGSNGSITEIHAVTPENLIVAHNKAASYATRMSVPIPALAPDSRINTIRGSTSVSCETVNTLIKHIDSISRAIIIAPSLSDKLKACAIRPYKRINPVTVLGRELKRTFYSLLEGEENTFLSIDFPESQVTRISLSPISSASSFKRNLIPFCERQLVYEDLHPSDSTPFKHQLIPDKPTMNLNQFVWKRQLVTNLLSVYSSHEVIIKSLQLQCRMAEYAARSGPSSNQMNQEYTNAYQQMYTTMHTIAYSINDSFSYRLHINNQICNHLIMRYNEVSKLLRAQPLLKNSAEAVISMSIARENNVKTLYQSFKNTVPHLLLTSFDKKVILYLLKHRKAKYPETIEITLNQYLRDKYAPRLPPNLCNREAAVQYIIAQKWSDTSSNHLVEHLKIKILARIDELIANNMDTEEAERSLIQLLLYNLNCNHILSGTFSGIFNNCTTVQHAEATVNLAASNFGYSTFKRQDIAPLPKEYCLTITANRCTPSTQQTTHDLPPEPRHFSLKKDNPLGLCSAEEYSPEIYEPPESYAQCWKPLW